MKIRNLLVLALCLASSAAFAQPVQRVRGTITAVSGDTMSFKSREGDDLKITLPSDLAVGAMKNITLADVKPGSFVGTTAVKDKDGQMVAREVHVLPPNTNPGHRTWDLEPNSTMTNGDVKESTQTVKGRVLTITYQGGQQQVLIPQGIPIVTRIAAARSDLVPGAYAVLMVKRDGDKLVAVNVQVTKDGVRPPQ